MRACRTPASVDGTRTSSSLSAETRHGSLAVTMTPSSISMPISSSTKYGLPSALLASRSRSAVGTVSSRLQQRLDQLARAALGERREVDAQVVAAAAAPERPALVERRARQAEDETSAGRRTPATRWLTKSSEPSSAQCRSSSSSTIGVPLSRCRARKYDASAWNARSRICLASLAIAAMCGSSRVVEADQLADQRRVLGRALAEHRRRGRRRACPARPTANRSRGSRSARRAGRAAGRTGRCCRTAAAGPGRSAPARCSSSSQCVNSRPRRLLPMPGSPTIVTWRSALVLARALERFGDARRARRRGRPSASRFPRGRGWPCGTRAAWRA